MVSATPERAVEVAALARGPGRLGADRLEEPVPEQVAVGARRRHGHDVHVLGGQALPPGAEHAGQVERAVEPRLAVLEPVEEAAVGPGAALLDALLPGRRDLAGEVAHGEDDVHLGRPGAAAEVVLGLGDRVRGGGREDLVADHDRPRTAPGPLDQGVPAAVGVTDRSAPVLAEQVERRPEVEQRRRHQRGAAGEVHPVRGEALGVELEPVLQVGRAGLGGSDMEVDAAAHDPDCASARTTAEGLGRPRCPAIHALVSTSAARSTPCSMPRPVSIQTRSSVARLPVALLA